MSLLISGSIKSEKGKKQIRNGKNKMKRSVKEWERKGKESNRTKRKKGKWERSSKKELWRNRKKRKEGKEMSKTVENEARGKRKIAKEWN